MVEKLVVTPEEAAEALAVGRTKIYELLKAGDIDSVRIGASRRIPIAALEEYIAERCQAAWMG